MKRLIITAITALCVTANIFGDVYTTRFVSSVHSRNKTLEAGIGNNRYSFAFDTGCSGLHINLNLLKELQQKGLIDASNSSQIRQAEMANGRTHAVREFAIKQLQIGEYVFHNVVASVGINDEPDAEPLLGQSILSRMKWYKIEGNTFSFVPQDEQLQQAMFYTDFYRDDDSYTQDIIDRLMPYKTVLPCNYLYQLMGQLDKAHSYSDAIDVIHLMQQNGCTTTEDFTERELYLLYNWAVNLYNTDNYDDCSEVVGKAETIMQTYLITDKDLLQAMGKLLYHFYTQTGNESKAAQYNKYK